MSTVSSFLRDREKLMSSHITVNTEQWQGDMSKLELVGGLDISFDPKLAPNTTPIAAAAALVVCSLPNLDTVYSKVVVDTVDVPYVPGLLAMREAPMLINLVKHVSIAKPAFMPQVLLVDGNGLLHPHKFGLACQLGVELDLPTIGAAKELFQMDDLTRDRSFRTRIKDLRKVGDQIELRARDELLGLALKTGKLAQKPLYVSVGHKIDLDTSKQVVMMCCKHRVPEPIRRADFLSRQYFRDKISQ